MLVINVSPGDTHFFMLEKAPELLHTVEFIREGLSVDDFVHMLQQFQIVLACDPARLAQI